MEDDSLFASFPKRTPRNDWSCNWSFPNEVARANQKWVWAQTSLLTSVALWICRVRSTRLNSALADRSKGKRQSSTSLVKCLQRTNHGRVFPWSNVCQCIAQIYRLQNLKWSVDIEHETETNLHAELISYLSVARCETFYQFDRTRMGPYATRVFFASARYNFSFLRLTDARSMSSLTVLTECAANAGERNSFSMR